MCYTSTGLSSGSYDFDRYRSYEAGAVSLTDESESENRLDPDVVESGFVGSWQPTTRSDLSSFLHPERTRLFRPAITAHTEKDQLIENLKAAEGDPELALNLIEQHGDLFLRRGLSAQLNELILSVPEAFHANPIFLFWQLYLPQGIAFSDEFIAKVESALKRADDPNLRAVYAEHLFTVGDLEGFLRESKSAVEAGRTSITLLTYGRALGLTTPSKGVDAFEEGLRLAEEAEAYFLALRIVTALIARLNSLGLFQATLAWGEWGFKILEKHEVSSVKIRLEIINEVSFAKVLLGDTAGLAESLTRELSQLSDTSARERLLLLTTLADALLAENRADDAIKVYHSLWMENTHRERIGALANSYVRALLETEGQQAALGISEQAAVLTRNLHPIYGRRAELALGMAKASSYPNEAIPHLERAFQSMLSPMLIPRLWQAGLYLTLALLKSDKKERAVKVIDSIADELSRTGEGGFNYLIGPAEEAAQVKELMFSSKSGLDLYFLNATDARFRKEKTALRLRFAELLVTLAIYPNGLTSEQLTLLVYGDAASPATCTVEMGRLRKLFPIESKPYRIVCDFWADFLEVQQLIDQGQIRSAVSLYRGPLLPASQAPAVVQHRDFLEAILESAVMKSNDLEALWLLKDKTRDDDLEIWEGILQLLPEDDPRKPIARFKVKDLSSDFGV